jgi:hypothetical protein
MRGVTEEFCFAKDDLLEKSIPLAPFTKGGTVNELV